MHNNLVCDLDWDSQSCVCSLLAYLNSRTYVIMCIHDLYFAGAITTVSFSLSLSCSLLIPFMIWFFVSFILILLLSLLLLVFTSITISNENRKASLEEHHVHHYVNSQNSEN